MARRKKPTLTHYSAVYLFKLLFIHPWLILPALLTGAGWYGYEVQIARPQMAYMGVPAERDWKQPLTWFRVLRNDAFMLGYSDLRGNPLWVSYKLLPLPGNAPHYKRPGSFSPDWRSINRVSHEDYRRSGYDRGHMAPNYAISRLYGREAQLDTFLMSNVTPQKPNLNEKLWQRLEAVEIDHFAPQFGEVWVITGPIFTGSIERLTHARNVEIPDAFYKIYAVPDPSGQQPKLLAFIMPQQVHGNEPLTQFTVSVDKIEALTGLDFFSALPDAFEQQVEASVDIAPWHLQQVAKLPPRY